MKFNYPNGKKFVGNSTKETTNANPEKKVQKIQKNNKITTHSNRGQSFEDDINETNQYYLERGLAVIHKKPTPIQIVKVDYPKRSAATIKEAYFKTPSTTDYNGLYKGRYIDFEAKETNSKTSFPLSNIHEHQILHLKSVKEHGGIGFFIIRFSETNEVYVLESEHVFSFWDKKETERKSIPKQFIEEHGISVLIGWHPRLSYLEAIDKLIDKLSS
ncbi:Holliday junction resolvase RecU [Bacillus cereus]|uniref:Holliday junction resolvase RecU n=1 Tax=Bacillus cereus TaxID=1396 RepID=A0A9X6STI0_BACCE|nr:Holliday junction resolvase RecU [Bacillus cereus]PDZ94870.1 Holliday junction resolvase RecU [Bacillus cereus]